MNKHLLALYNKLAKGGLLTPEECRSLEELELLDLREEQTDTETRVELGLELRAADAKFPGSPGTIVGRPAKYNNLSSDLGGFKENIVEGAFTTDLKNDKHDIRALVGHDKNRILARRSAGTLVITEDKVGLACDIHTIGTTEGRDAYMNVQAGNLDSMSFGFKPRKLKWSREGSTMVRNLLDINLGEVSVVGLAAYPNTTLAARELKVFVATTGTPVKLLRLRRQRMDY